MEIRDIVKDWLEENGYTGLCYVNTYDDVCICTTKDLMRCLTPLPNCEAVYVTLATENGETGYIASRTKPETTEGGE